MIQLSRGVKTGEVCVCADMEKVESLPPADLHFQISAKVKFQIQAFFLDFSASPTRLLDTFSMSVYPP